MKNTDNDLKFHLSQGGWYLGDAKIKIVKEHFMKNLPKLGIDTNKCKFSNSGMGAWTCGDDIFINEGIAWVASLAQMEFLTLHEHFHKVLGHCDHKKPMLSLDCHKQEFECDRRALISLVQSGRYNIKELYDAIALYGEVIDEPETFEYPSSKSRYKRLLNQLKESV